MRASWRAEQRLALVQRRVVDDCREQAPQRRPDRRALAQARGDQVVAAHAPGRRARPAAPTPARRAASKRSRAAARSARDRHAAADAIPAAQREQVARALAAHAREEDARGSARRAPGPRRRSARARAPMTDATVSLSYVRRRSAARVMRAPASACWRGPGAAGLPTSCQNAARRWLARCMIMHRGVEHVQDVLVERVGLRGRLLVEADARRPLGQRHCERAHVARQPQRLRRRRGRRTMRSSSSRTRSADSSAMRGAAAAMSSRVPRSGCSPSRLQRATPRRMRSGSSRNAVACTARRTPARRSSRPPNGSIHSPRAHVPRHRVDREVAALEVVAHRQLGVGLDAEVGVRVAGVVRLARRDRRLAPRRDDLDALARPPRRPEAHADEAARDAQLVGLAVARGRARAAPRRRARARGSRRPWAPARAARRAASRPTS